MKTGNCHVTCVILAVTAVRFLTVDFLNTASPCQFRHGLPVVNGVGRVDMRKCFALRKGNGMRRDHFVFLVRWFQRWRQSEREID